MCGTEHPLLFADFVVLGAFSILQEKAFKKKIVFLSSKQSFCAGNTTYIAVAFLWEQYTEIWIKYIKTDNLVEAIKSF